MNNMGAESKALLEAVRSEISSLRKDVKLEIASVKTRFKKWNCLISAIIGVFVGFVLGGFY